MTISEKGLMLSPLLGVFCRERNPDDGVAPDISDAGVPKSSRPLSSGEPNSPVQSGENRQNASSEEHLGTKISSSSKSTPPSLRGDASQFTDASSLPHFVEDVQASAPDGEDSQWMDARDGSSSRSWLVNPSPAIARMPRGRHLRRSPTPGTTWWPAAKHAGVADPHAAATSGEIDAWTGGVAPVDGVASESAFFSGVKAWNSSSCSSFAGHCFLPAAGPVLLIRAPNGSCPPILGSCPAHLCDLVLDSLSGSRSGPLDPGRCLESGRLGVRGVDADLALDLDPEEAAAEGRRKRKHPGRSRAAEASLELRSDSGLRRRLEPTVLGLGAVAGDGEGDGEGFRGLEAEQEEDGRDDGLAMAAAAEGMAVRGVKRRRVRRFQISEIGGRRRKRANGYILQSKPGIPVVVVDRRHKYFIRPKARSGLQRLMDMVWTS